MGSDNLRPGLFRETTADGRSSEPLLSKPDSEGGDLGDKDIERGRSSRSSGDRNSGASNIGSGPLYDSPISRPATMMRRSTMRSRSPGQLAASSARKKYTYAAFFLVLSLVAFCVQTELSAYIQGDLGWDKAYCMMFFTHSSWVLMWPVQLLILRLQKRGMPWETFWRRHMQLVKSTALMVELQTLDVFGLQRPASKSVRYLARTTAFITTALTVAGLSWYVAVSLTTPSDLTAIYNCSAFFAYAFSVPLLKEPLRLDKSVAVIIAIVGVLVVAYGDTGSKSAEGKQGEGEGVDVDAGSRFLGNIVIGIGSVLYGLYEVLYKRFACPPDGVSPGRGMIFANTFGSCIGLFTVSVLWIPLPILHWLGLEIFEIPDASTCWLILFAVLSNATFSASFLILISLTSPVLSSVAALLTIFIVALADWFITGQPLSPAAVIGGSMIIIAFGALSWSTYREMMEHEIAKRKVDLTDSDEEGDLSSHED
ncbi:drug metabolite transporter [Trichoderma arundinaceum]|uniref:Drug metabolite transporter n=1 Tax=Trichoderma arundinaceum TaxID=490622 RepID=A0A395NQZ1_TRIAR|nr:drug metabolite transporter [Trichoderma arundinaceum]